MFQPHLHTGGIRTELYEFMNQLNELNKGIGLVLDG